MSVTETGSPSASPPPRFLGPFALQSECKPMIAHWCANNYDAIEITFWSMYRLQHKRRNVSGGRLARIGFLPSFREIVRATLTEIASLPLVCDVRVFSTFSTCLEYHHYGTDLSSVDEGNTTDSREIIKVNGLSRYEKPRTSVFG